MVKHMQMQLNNLSFPLYKIGTFVSLEKNLLGVTWITTGFGKYVLDDSCYKGTFEKRRLKMYIDYAPKQIYKLKKRIVLLRQLIKYPGGTNFIDNEGALITYRKGNKMYNIHSEIITRVKPYKDTWTTIYSMGREMPFLLHYVLPPTATHISVMETPWGPFLYDVVASSHKIYRRKI